MIVVFGAGGLLGSHLCALYPQETIAIDHKSCNIANPYEVHHVISSYKPEAVINCAGVVPKAQSYHAGQWLDVYRINACAPRWIREVCDECGVKLVQMSTNCVFSGKKGDRTETDIPNPRDMYGMSKFLGEITDYPHLTVRTSFIGYPDPKGRGLLAWFKDAPNPVPGYMQTWWNGITTVALAMLLMETLIPRLATGLVHVYNEHTICKGELLQIVNRVYDWHKEIIPTDEPRAFTTLLSDRARVFSIDTSYQQLIEEMRAKESILRSYIAALV